MIYINHVELTNFRNYQHLSLSLGKSTTIFIGKNGAGKTNLITAIKQSLSFIFSKKKDSLQYEFIASSDQKVKSFQPTDPRYVKSGDKGNYTYPIAISTSMKVEDIQLSWELRRRTLDRGIDESYVNESIRFWQQFPNFTNLPVFAFFSDSYPHILSTMGSKMQSMLDSGNPLPQNVGFYKWDEERNCIEIWKQYFVMNWKNAKYTDNPKLKKYVEDIVSSMRLFTSPISSNEDNPEFQIADIEIEARGKEDVMVVLFSNGKRVPFDMLSQGYKRILSIVFDLLHRSYLLNGTCSSHGVVFIDEIELHLHPSLAQEVVARLRRTFGSMQFVISTHSPLVIADYKQDEDNMLYGLNCSVDESGFAMLQNLYGLDYVTILKSVMETPERDSYLQNLLGAYKYWSGLNDVKRMKQVSESIKRLTGKDSVVYRNLTDDGVHK